MADNFSSAPSPNPKPATAPPFGLAIEASDAAVALEIPGEAPLAAFVIA